MQQLKTKRDIDREAREKKVVLMLARLKDEYPEATPHRICSSAAVKLRLSRSGVEKIARRAGVYDMLRKP